MTQPSTTVPPVQSTPPRPVRYWNEVLLNVFREIGGAPGPLARTAAMMHGAIFDVVNNQTRVDRGLDALPYLSYLGMLPAVPGGSMIDAVNLAAREVLLGLHPESEASVTAAFAALYPAGAPPVVAPLGRAAARAMLRARAHDGADAFTPYTLDDVPGAWRPTTAGMGAATPHWGRVALFSGRSASTFRPPPPGGFTGYAELLASRYYADQVNEVKVLGARDCPQRSTDDTEAAWFWANDLDGTYKPPGHLLRITTELAVADDLLAEARLLALVSFALADATAVAWDSKYDTAIDLWRPESAIRLAGTDGNPHTIADPHWRPLSADRSGAAFTPPFPAYLSGHATLAGAWAGVMRRYFGTDDWTFTTGSEDPHLPTGTTRTFTSFTAAAAENARSRVHLGVHYQADADRGIEAGEALARHVYRTQFYAPDEH